jgi:hypothetical protein
MFAKNVLFPVILVFEHHFVQYGYSVTTRSFLHLRRNTWHQSVRRQCIFHLINFLDMKSHLFFFSALLIFSIDASAFSGTGSGTSADPYVVTTAAQLNEVRNALTASYKLGADIDLTAWIATNSPTAGWEPIGFGTLEDPHPFKGTLDGDGHFITGLWSNRPDHNYIGLFGQVTGIVEFRNLGVVIAEGKSLNGYLYK